MFLEKPKSMTLCTQWQDSSVVDAAIIGLYAASYTLSCSVSAMQMLKSINAIL